MTWMVLGAGRSGIAAAKLLAWKGHNVVLADSGPIPDSTKNKLPTSTVTFYEQDQREVLDQRVSSGLILSPGIHSRHPYINQAKKRGLPILSEVDLALSYYDGVVISVTGTNGKSTTVAMAYHLLDTMGYKAALAGNIGTPPSEIITDCKKAPEFMVLELSSYQLEQSNKIRSHATAILNLSPDHLARHGTMEQYLREKWKIVLMCPKSSHGLVDSKVMAMASKLPQPTCPIELVEAEQAIAAVDPSLSGQHEWHNRLNGYYASHLVAQVLQAPISSIIPHLSTFRGLSHRFEKVGTIKGATVINDSKATNVDSTLVALSNLKKPATLLLGGQGKGESFVEVKKYRHHIKNLLIFGQDAPIISEELKDMEPVQYTNLRTMMKALPKLFYRDQHPPDLIFSPGCASFDEFRNFEERGNFFKSEIKALLDPY